MNYKTMSTKELLEFQVWLHHVTFLGSQVKKDGTVGSSPVREEVYRPSQHSKWLSEMADEVLRALQT